MWRRNTTSSWADEDAVRTSRVGCGVAGCRAARCWALPCVETVYPLGPLGVNSMHASCRQRPCVGGQTEDLG